MTTQDVILFKAEDGKTAIEVHLENETVWLTQKQMAELFGKGVPTINEHVKNIYKEEELVENSTIRKFRIVQREGKREVEREVDHYNLDVIISVGYRVNSKRGTQFRQWATSVLRQHLVQGYTLNEKRLREQNNRLYPSLEEKAANLLYFVVKNHSFSDGNKRIAAVLFTWFLDKNQALYRTDGTRRLADNALVALTLMIAESKSEEKDVMIKVIVNLINQNN
jgi:hypothetical protein